MGEEPDKELIVKFMEAYWRNFHAGDIGSKYYNKLMETLRQSGNAYELLSEWDAKDNAPFGDDDEKVNNAAGTLLGEHRRNGVQGLQELVDEWFKKHPAPPKKPSKKKEGKGRPYYLDREELEYGP